MPRKEEGREGLGTGGISWKATFQKTEWEGTPDLNWEGHFESESK